MMGRRAGPCGHGRGLEPAPSGGWRIAPVGSAGHAGALPVRFEVTWRGPRPSIRRSSSIARVRSCVPALRATPSSSRQARALWHVAGRWTASQRCLVGGTATALQGSPVHSFIRRHTLCISPRCPETRSNRWPTCSSGSVASWPESTPGPTWRWRSRRRGGRAVVTMRTRRCAPGCTDSGRFGRLSVHPDMPLSPRKTIADCSSAGSRHSARRSLGTTASSGPTATA